MSRVSDRWTHTPREHGKVVRKKMMEARPKRFKPSLFKVGHLNGQGLATSEYYINEENLPTLAAAKKRAQEIRAQNPEHDGWYKIVAVLDAEDTPIWSPDFD